MKKVLVTNITNKDQIVIDILANKAVTISPDAGYVIDTYNKNHVYLYNSYARKGLRVEYVGDEFFNNVTTLNETPDKDGKFDVNLPEITESTVTEEKEFIPETSTVTEEVVDEKPKSKKRSRKNTNSSDNSEMFSATSESGE